MRIAYIIIRTLVGLFLLFASVMYFLDMMPKDQKMSPEMTTVMTGFFATGYLFTLVKALELICGLAFLVGRYVTLANLVILPVTVNILLINILLTPDQALPAVLLFAGNIFLIYYKWSNYKTVMAP